MRHTIWVLLLAVTVCVVWYSSWTMGVGAQLREHEREAAAAVSEVMHAQENWRKSATDTSAELYAGFDELLAAGKLDDFEKMKATEHWETYRRGAYLFRLEVASSFEPQEGVLGADRFELWAWPASQEHGSLVLYYASNAGFLIQGENGGSTGLDGAPLSLRPLRDLQDARDDKRPTKRWKIIENIRRQRRQEEQS